MRALPIAKVVDRLPRWARRHKVVRLLLSVSPASRIQEVRFNGRARLLADVRDPFPRAYLLSGQFEPEFFAIAGPFLRAGGVFVDAGANFGFCSFGLIAHLDLPPGQVEYHLIEANRDLCDLLRRSASLHPAERLLVTFGCVTDTPGVSRLHVVPSQLGASYVADDGTQEVANVVLDEYVRTHAITRVDLLKLDVEGLEPSVLRGAARSLQAGVVSAVYVEVSSSNLARQGFDPEDVLGPLRSANYELLYVKEVDFRRLARRAAVTTVTVNGRALRVAPVGVFPSGHQTDVLAVRRERLKAWQPQ